MNTSRADIQSLPVAANDMAAAPTVAGRRMALLCLAAMAAMVAAYFWLHVLRVPLDRPVGSLFGSGPAIKEGWAPLYAPLLFAAGLTLAIFSLYLRKPRRWTLLSLAFAGLFAVVFGAWSAYWVKNIGYTWYFVPGANAAAILGVQLQMGPFALGRAIQALVQTPLLLAIGAVSGALVGLLLQRPLRATPAPVGAQAAHRAGWTARIVTSILMALMGGAVGYGAWIVGLVVMPIAGLLWFFLAFRKGLYSFRNVLIGGGLIGLLSCLPLAVASMHSGLRNPFEPSGGPLIDITALLDVFLRGAAIRVPVFVLISVGLIKLTLLISRMTAYALRGVRRAPAAG